MQNLVNLSSGTMIVTNVGTVLLLIFGLEANPAPGPKPAPAPSPFMWGQPGPVLPPYQPGSELKYISSNFNLLTFLSQPFALPFPELHNNLFVNNYNIAYFGCNRSV